MQQADHVPRTREYPHVSIITHDDFIGNCMEIHLMQCFQELGLFFEILSLSNDVRVVDPKDNELLLGELTLISTPYTKKIINSTEKLKSIAPELMIILCHGKRKGTTPSGVCLCPEEMTILPANLLIFASDDYTHFKDDGSRDKLPSTCVMLAEVTTQSKLAIVLCCRGDEILSDFKSTNPKNFTDMLVCDRPDLDNISFCIFYVLLFNLVDCDVRVRPAPGQPQPKMHEVVKHNIRQIFKLISTHGKSAEEFWKFLENHDCVTDLEEVKQRQKFDHNRGDFIHGYFRVSGVAFNFEYSKLNTNTGESECKKETILQDFKALKLVYWDEERQSIGEESWKTYDSHVEENSGDEYWQMPFDLHPHLEEQELSPRPSPAKRPKGQGEASQMSRLLESLKLTA